MPYGYIYKIEFPNGKVYIGQTSRTLEERKKEHKRCAKKGVPYYVYNVLRCHNMVDTFELIEIDTADTKEELDEKEKGYILMYKSLDREYGYNRTIGGDGVIGCVRTEENRKNMSEGIKKYYEENPEARQKNSERQKKYHLEHPEKAQRHSERQKKRYEDPEERQKTSESIKKYYEETPGAREKNSERQKKYYEETSGAREKNSKAKKKYYKETPGAREKHSEAQKKRFENPEEKQKFLDARGKNKPFDVFTKDGTFVKTFTYQMDAREYLQKEYGITSTIKSCEVLRGGRKSTAGFVFKYK